MSDGAVLAICLTLLISSCNIGANIAGLANAVRDVEKVEVRK